MVHDGSWNFWNKWNPQCKYRIKIKIYSRIFRHSIMSKLPMIDQHNYYNSPSNTQVQCKDFKPYPFCKNVASHSFNSWNQLKFIAISILEIVINPSFYGYLALSLRTNIPLSAIQEKVSPNSWNSCLLVCFIEASQYPQWFFPPNFQPHSSRENCHSSVEFHWGFPAP